ncbi:decaprenyl-phosphate phosphoribosyltransferase [Actinacidiphila acididurans]|uniref:Decaprenyl-phosphate phosphoribosyltransferase n=1 Tax=Actinacidiphila acididurans TaxID=2784346 RepID=A0ABS2TMU3_9ACTN|nr:decaprenyl-phosphate phosphoribosyltransferase [Actinacidiphila acididurans]MBM9504670.1 decaprenyl-phosphate phosphoribosyltransferase [Actinacidiphila acididurans]
MAEQSTVVIEEPAAPAASLAAGLLRTARPRQWIKNGLVLAAPFAAAKLLTAAETIRLGVVFVLFTACSAAVYLINDARDAEADRAHPVKRNRPVAAGHVPVAAAYAAGAVLAVLAPAAAAVTCTPDTAVLLAGYVLMQLAYCVWLKHLLVIDLVIVTAGFLLRSMAGGIALGIAVSRWFLVTAGFGALFMVAAKRYSELVLMTRRPRGPGAPLGASRALLGSYTPGYLRFVWQLAAGVAVLAYCLWAMETGAEPHGWLPWRQLSMVPFTLAVLRYAVFADSGSAGEPEDLVLRDSALVAIGLVWGALYVLAVADT